MEMSHSLTVRSEGARHENDILSLLPKCTLGNFGLGCIHSRHLMREPWEGGCHAHVRCPFAAEEFTLAVDSISSLGRVQHYTLRVSRP